jgi:phosphosulfolactate phosphohydrolase-like enzyme
MAIEFTGTRTEYLGDGLYASFDGFQLWLETTNGVEITNRIALEPSVMAALSVYVDKVFNDRMKGRK